MTHMTDEQVLQNMNARYEMARSAQKEGKGTPRPHGAAGLIAAEWMRYRNEAKRRGLV